jgi:hypothetical protein
MNRSQTSVTFPEKAYLFETTTKELIRRRTSPGQSLLVRTIPEKTHGGLSYLPRKKP